ncbi:cytochrome P450 [Streptomyces seoulensis]|nr:cytochrome P450 [Streptomyces seoulensis]
MDADRRPPHPLSDQTLALLAGGYAWLPQRMRDSGGEPALTTRLMGKPVLAVRGPDAVRFFYDERNVHRHGAIPGPVQATLFGHGAVHTLDGTAHRERKGLFLPLLGADLIEGVVEQVVAAWDEAVAEWARRPRVVLFDEAAVVLTRGVHRWAGVPLPDAEAGAVARDLIAMVDGFATPGPRHWRARHARRRQEERLARLVRDVRSGRTPAAPGSLLERVAGHREGAGERLTPGTAAVELLNILRPTVAVSWFAAFAAHALHRLPGLRDRLRGGDPAEATAFAHEVRRFYPFAPFLGGLAARDLSWHGHTVPRGGMVLLDVYGQNHDAGLWGDPYAFRPERFLEHPAERDELIPQGGGDPRTGHRCPGEGVALGLLESLAVRLAGLEYEVPAQDLRIPLRRIPTRPRDGFVMSGVRAPEHRTNTSTDTENETDTKEPPAWDTAETSSTN